MRVLAFGTYDVRSHPRVAVLIEGLRAHGDEVVEVNVPLGIDTAARVALLRRPWRAPLFALRLARCWAVLAVRGRRLHRRFRPDVVLVGYLGHFDVRLARRLFGRTPVVLDHLIFAADTARDRKVATGWKIRLLELLDRGALRSADLVVLDTDEHAALMPADLADRGVVVPVGVPQSWFTAAEATRLDAAPGPAGGSVWDEPLRAIFFGLFTPLQGTPVLAEALAALADRSDIEVLAVGHGQDLPAARQAAAANEHITWRDWIPAEELPSVVARHDVCLGIFGTGPKALRVVPNKVYQGAAAGCAVITSDTPPQRRALGTAGYHVPPGDAAALADALRTLASDRQRLTALRKEAHERALAEFSPSVVVRDLRERINALLA